MAAACADELVTHRGACHCRAVTFEMRAPARVTVWVCNCSICALKRNDHVIVPAANFTLLTGEDALTRYTFNTHTAQHMFCKVCGVQAFYRPRSNPDGYAVTFACLEPGTVAVAEHRFFEGANWEKQYASLGGGGALLSAKPETDASRSGPGSAE